MMTTAKLCTRTVKDLATLAKKKSIAGWHSMRKDELVRALVNHGRAAAARATRRAKTKGKATVTAKVVRTNGNGKHTRANGNGKHACTNGNGKHARTNGKKTGTRHTERRLKKIKAQLALSKDLALKAERDGSGHPKDRLVVMVRDPYWLHAYWELTRAAIARAKAALGQYWHGARPVLRVSQVSRNGTTDSARKHLRDIPIHGGVSNWYVDVQDPPKSYQLEIGYLGIGDKFLALARSNVVTTPRPGSSDSFDKNWAEVAKDFDRIFAMSGGYGEEATNRELREVFEEQLRRPMGDPMVTQFGIGAGGPNRDFNFNVDTELIVHGSTDPDAHVTLRGEPIHLRPDGTFAVRFNLPDRRHVLPVVASSSDGVEQRTIVLAVDRNTKVMEPVIRGPGS